MIWTGIDMSTIILSLVLVALSASLIALGWRIARKTMLEGYRMGRMSSGQPDIGPLETPKRGRAVRLDEEYDVFNEALRDPATRPINTMGEGGSA